MFDGNNTQYYGQQQMGGYNFAGMNPTAAQPIKNALTDEQIKQLTAQVNNFSLGLTERDVLRAKCTHRKPGGMEDSLTFDPNTGIARCTICGYEFQPIDPDTSIESVIESVNKVLDTLQTIKLLYPTLPAEAVGEYFQIIPLLEKIPEFFKLAVKEFAKGDVNPWTYSNFNMGGAAMFANLMNAFGNGFVPQQPMGYGYGQQPQQFMNPPMGGVTPQANAFGYPGASQQPTFGYQPATPQGYAFQPGQVATPVQPTVSAPAQAPAAPEAVDVVTSNVQA